MRALLLAAALLLAFVSPGCLGSVEAAGIPQESLDQNGWQQRGEPSRDSVAFGLGEKVVIEYAPSGPVGSFGAGVTAVTANDVPIVDESDFIPEALDRISQQQGIAFERAGSTTLELVNLDTSEQADLYTVEKDGQQGKAVLFTPNCGDFVVVVGWGATAQGLTDNLFQQARDVSKTVVCSV